MTADPKPTRTVELRRRRQAVILAAAGGMVGLVLLLVVWNLDPSRGAPERPSDSTGRETFDEIDPSAPRTSRGWIQITDEQGRLAQQYRCAHLDPNPDGRGAGWIRMEAPEIELHLDNGTLISMRSRTALVHAPTNSVESGELRGDVVILIYESARQAAEEGAERPLPTTRIRTEHASFNSLLGTVECPQAITIETQRGLFDGRHLRLWLSDGDTAISNLIVEEVENIRIARAAIEARDATARSASETRGPVARDARLASLQTSSGNARAPRPRRGTSSESEVSRAEPWYRLRLSRDVRVLTGEGTESEQRITGEELTMLFTLRSRGVPMGGAVERTAGRAPHGARTAPPPLSLPVHLAALVLTSSAPLPDHERAIAPPPHPDDVHIRCRGQLVIRPLEAHVTPPANTESAVLEMIGHPVLLEAPAEGATARAARLRYHTAERRIELDADHGDEPVRAKHPQFELECRQLHLAADIGTGRLQGPGNVRFLRPGEDRTDLIDITWNERLDLRFGAGTEGRADLRDLQHAAFRGGAEVSSIGGAENLDLLAAGTTQDARLSAREIDVSFDRASDEPGGTPSIRAIDAREDVIVTSEARQLRAEEFRAILSPNTEAPDRLTIESVHAERAVHLTLPDGAEIFADLLEVDAGTRRAVLTGQDVRLRDARHLIDQARRIEIDETEDLYRIVGRGRFWRFAEPETPGTAPQEELRITWTEGVTATPADVEDGDAREVTFEGDVRVRTIDLNLAGADLLTARLVPGRDADDTIIERITATGRIDARTLGAESDPGGHIRAETLIIDLDQAPAPTGSLRPRRLRAEGSVEAGDRFSTIESDALDVHFTDEADPQRVSIHEAVATGNVRVRLRDGELVLADRLDVDAQGDRAVLTGAPLLVLSPQFMLDRGERLEIDRASGRYDMIGPGRLLGFAEAFDTDSVAPDAEAEAIVARAEALARSLTASWSESAHVASADGTRGTMEFRGEVDVQSDPSPLERSHLNGARVVLEFDRRAGHRASTETGLNVQRLEAYREASMEHRLWAADDRSDVPRVLTVRGPEVRFDQERLALDVRGPGELLVRAGDADRERPDTPGAAGFHAAGTTLFRWQREMSVRRIVDDQYLIRMEGDVQCLHRAPDETTSTITARVLEASVLRSEPSGAPRATSAPGGFDPGGSMTLRRLQGEGGVFVRTPRRDLTCDLFDYNLSTGIAVLSSLPGRAPVSILTEGVTQPVTAERVIWNLQDDTVTISRGGGGS